MKGSQKAQSGRAANINPANRFDKYSYADEPGLDAIGENEALKTKYIKVHPKSILNKIESPDVHMMYSANPYQGCEHGCAYCYARPTHNYWGYSAGLDFEQKILYKENAAALLREKFESKSWQGAVISLSGNTDCYQPIERSLGITRQMLQVCSDYNNPVGIIMKNALITRDIAILADMASRNLVHVIITINTLNEQLRRAMEPRTASAAKRLATIKVLSEAGIPVMVMVSPIIPSLNDHEILQIMEQAAHAGALTATYIIVRLNGDVGLIFTDWIKQAFPGRAERVLNQIKHMHGGKISDNRFGMRMKGEGVFAEMINAQFKIGKQKYFKSKEMPALDQLSFRRPYGQQQLF